MLFASPDALADLPVVGYRIPRCTLVSLSEIGSCGLEKKCRIGKFIPIYRRQPRGVQQKRLIRKKLAILSGLAGAIA